MSGLMADLIEERLRSLPLDRSEGVQNAIEETVEIVHSYANGWAFVFGLCTSASLSGVGLQSCRKPLVWLFMEIPS
jgi:hypothetical protein